MKQTPMKQTPMKQTPMKQQFLQDVKKNLLKKAIKLFGIFGNISMKRLLKMKFPLISKTFLNTYTMK